MHLTPLRTDALFSALALHPGGKHIALLTGNHASGNMSRVFLYKFRDGERKATIWTGACSSPVPRPSSSPPLAPTNHSQHPLTHLSTPFLSAPTTACDQFSSPRMAWFPDGSAVAVTSDDGIVRIVDLHGRVRALIPAHGVHPLTGVRSEMVRDICVVVGEEGKVGVISCGFDQTVRVMG